MQHELAMRSDAGIVVRLLWDSARDCVVLRYRDERTDDAFVVEVPKNRAMEAFHHSNVYRSSCIAAAG